MPVGQISQSVERDEGHPKAFGDCSAHECLDHSTIGSLDSVGVGWDSGDFLKGVFGGKALGPLIRADLLTPDLLENQGPQLDPLYYSRVDEVVILRGHAVVHHHPVLLPVAENCSTVGPVAVRLLGFDKSGQKAGFRLSSAEQVEDCAQVGKFNLELDEAGEVGLLLLGVDSGAVVAEVEEHGQPHRLLVAEPELVILEDLCGVALDERDDLGVAILLMAEGKDGPEDLFVRRILSKAVGVALFELRRLDLFG